jgi:hypothetical protein
LKVVEKIEDLLPEVVFGKLFYPLFPIMRNSMKVHYGKDKDFFIPIFKKNSIRKTLG